MAHLAERRFGTLSEGERKRVQIARALMTDPELMLLDEPAAGLDLGGREDLVRRLGLIAADEDAPALVLVTHHVEEIPPGFTHVLLLRGGRVVAAGPIAHDPHRRRAGRDLRHRAGARPLRPPLDRPRHLTAPVTAAPCAGRRGPAYVVDAGRWAGRDWGGRSSRDGIGGGVDGFGDYDWVAWLGLAVVLGIVEVTTLDLVFAMLAAGALAPEPSPACVTDSAPLQVLVVAGRVGRRCSPSSGRWPCDTCAPRVAIRTGTAALIGQRGVVARAGRRRERPGQAQGRGLVGPLVRPPPHDRGRAPRRGRADRRGHRGRLRIGDLMGSLVALGVVAAVALLVLVALAKTVRIVPQARAGVVERLGRYSRTLTPGLTILVPFIDRLRPLIDLREQVVSFPPQPVITADNLVVGIDTVIYFQVTDAKAATYEIANYIQGVEQLTVTTLRNVVGNLNLEETLTSRDHINAALRGVLDEATGKWGIRVNRVEIKAIDPPTSIQDSMEKQMRADREKRATILTAEGFKQSQILTAEGERQAAILKAEGDAQAAVLRADGEAQAIQKVFDAIHAGDPDQKLLAYQYLQMLPKIAQGDSNKVWIVPSELGEALKGIGGMLGDGIEQHAAADRPA